MYIMLQHIHPQHTHTTPTVPILYSMKKERRCTKSVLRKRGNFEMGYEKHVVDVCTSV